MGRFTIEKWQCDRCREVHDSRPAKNYPYVTVRASVEEEWHTGATDWSEMCPRCNEEVLKLLPTLNYKKG